MLIGTRRFVSVYEVLNIPFQRAGRKTAGARSCAT